MSEINPAELGTMTLSRLYELARERDVKNPRKYKKQELIDILLGNASESADSGDGGDGGSSNGVHGAPESVLAEPAPRNGHSGEPTGEAANNEGTPAPRHDARQERGGDDRGGRRDERGDRDER